MLSIGILAETWTCSTKCNLLSYFHFLPKTTRLLYYIYVFYDKKKIGMVKRITHVKRRLCVLVLDNVEYFFSVV